MPNAKTLETVGASLSFHDFSMCSPFHVPLLADGVEQNMETRMTPGYNI